MGRTDTLRIAKTCAANWDALVGIDKTGDDRVRFCPDCGRNVHNISAMSRGEVHSLLAGSRQLPCMRGVCDERGLLMTAERLTRRSFTLVAAGAVPLIAIAGAQTSATILSGVVRDVTGVPIPKAEVTVVGGASGAELRRSTDERGEFRIAGLDAGDYSLRVSAPGFVQFRNDKLELKANSESAVAIQLMVGTMGEAEDRKPGWIKGHLLKLFR